VKTLVCRCEDVTLADVLEAIEKGHRDVESLKRYTGFATGYCQGKACLVACARLIARAEPEAAIVPVTPRPPAYPTPLGYFAAMPGEDDP
jgi:NAD(P)H-nitrite reductase large subunit